MHVERWQTKRLIVNHFNHSPTLPENNDRTKLLIFDHVVFEFGCGTGRLARQLLTEYLPADCRYTAVDISPKMVEITRVRLKPWQDRSNTMVTTGNIELDAAMSSLKRAYNP